VSSFGRQVDLAYALIGAAIITVGLIALLLSRSGTRGRDRTVAWFGVTWLVYGLRLVFDSTLVQQASGVAPDTWRYLSPACTYGILAPVGLLLLALLGAGPWGLLRWLWRIDLVYAIVAIASDIVRHQAASVMWMNPIMVGVNSAAAIAQGVRIGRGATWSREARIAMWSVVIFGVIAAYETFLNRYVGRLKYNIEPLGRLTMFGGLGYYVARRAFAAERRLAAISQELETARAIQQSILPRDLPSIPAARLAVRYIPMSEVAGDVYDFVPADAALGIMVADVAGHGVPAAMVASMAKVALHAQREHLGDPARMLHGMNNALCGYFDRTYVTAAFAWLDASGRRMSYANAGHPALIVRRADGRIERLSDRSMVLGFMPDVGYHNGFVDLHPRDAVLIVTDGILEAENPDGEFFGDAQLDAVLRTTNGSSADELAGRILAQLRNWTTRPESFADDVTLVVVEIV
jgi:sigma-B regulation protein RsbU (phosphoserine phosphatase)